MFRKSLFYILFFCFFNLQYAVSQKIKSSTNFESSTISYNTQKSSYHYFQNINFEQTLFYRKTYNKYNKETDSYYYNSLYFKDSIIGAKLTGYEFNLMHDRFEDSRFLNNFRRWNILRFGSFLGIEYNPFKGFLPLENSFEYINAGISIRYYHIRKSARGDKTTKYRKGEWGFLTEGEFNGRVYFDLYVKPFAYLWIHSRYRKELYKNTKYYALIFEFELNEHGYDKSQAQSNKDFYYGTTLFCGPEYNSYNYSWSFNIGIKMDYRNKLFPSPSIMFNVITS